MPTEPLEEITYDLEEAIQLLLALEQARDVLTGTDFWSPLAAIEHQIGALVRKLGLEGGSDG